MIQKAKTQIRRTGIRRRYKRAMQGRPDGLESFTLPELAASTPYPPGEHRADVVHLHWVANLIDYCSFFASIPDELPIVWTLHDMNPFTGGCHYANDCAAFVTQCARCPQLSRGANTDLANRNFRVKRDSFKHKNLHIVAPSRWLLKEAQQSQLFRGAASFRCIPYGLDTDVFAPLDKLAAKRKLGLPVDQFVVAFVAEEVGNQRKGGRHLLAALAKLSSQRVNGLVLGGGKLPASDSELPPMHHVSFERDAKRQATIYSAADVLVLPSLADNLPLTGLEALACGTPVIGFDVGGIPDYVRNGKTGILVPVGDSNMLAEKIAFLADHPSECKRMGEAGRAMMVSEFRSDIQAARYHDMYSWLMERGKTSLKKSA